MPSHVETNMLPSMLPRVAGRDTCHCSSLVRCTSCLFDTWEGLPVDTLILLGALYAVSTGYRFDEAVKVPASKRSRGQRKRNDMKLMYAYGLQKYAILYRAGCTSAFVGGSTTRCLVDLSLSFDLDQAIHRQRTFNIHWDLHTISPADRLH